jgi:fucose permease
MTSLLLIGAGIGAMALPWLIGVVMQRFGSAMLMPALALDLAVLVLVVGALSPWLRSEVSRPPPGAAL